MAENSGSYAASIASPIGGIIQSWIGSRSVKKNTERTIAANKELAEYQYNKDLEMWNRANEYNSPEAQMERLKAAGLNPNLVYGSGSAAGNTSTQTPKYNAPQVEYHNIPPVDLPSTIAMYQDARLKQAQTDNVQAATENQRIQNAVDAAFAYNVKEEDYLTKHWKRKMGYVRDPIKNTMLDIQLDYMRPTTEQKLRNLQAQERMLAEGTENKAADTLFKQFKNDWMRMGITSSDNVMFRVLAKLWNELGINTWGELSQYGGKIWKPKR